jgi:predicted AlkP superfamily phosphohydrolase/phosphomutase
MVPSGDCGYIRLNLSGREREGIVDPKEANQVLEQIASGLLTFRDPDGTSAVKRVETVSQSPDAWTLSNPLPDLIVHWSDQMPQHMAGAYSPQFGEVPSAGWGSGRTGEHRDEAWALMIPGSSKKRTPIKPPHIMDIVPTICSVLGVDREGLAGHPLFESL